MNNASPYRKPEIWGGLECTINRTRDGYRDQLAETGHYARVNDLEQICSLGFRKIRFPILWERHWPVKDNGDNWNRTRQQLNILQQHKVEPIVGLLHHGSGPPDTDLLDPAFPMKLASYAAQVARAFPHIRYYTPVNEPLTTARFSGLYGFWYPHKKSDAAFARMLINQLRGTVLSMKAIREINPDALLVQTEDLSKTYSTPALAYQAEFENERRWLPLDLLMGSVGKDHFGWKYLTEHGITDEELDFFQTNKCPPDIAGFNYYVTSERFLDEKLENYPASNHGGNQYERYADIEACRSGHMRGLYHLLTEAWHRYHLPLAVTECHLNCTREQQMRWLYQHIADASALCNNGVRVEAVTAWSLTGSMDWSSLICEKRGHSEEGAFAVRDGQLQETATAALLRALANDGDCFHPALDGKGWWQPEQEPAFNRLCIHREGSRKKLLIIGGNTTLGNLLGQLCLERKLPFDSFAFNGRETPGDLRSIIQQYDPWAIVYAGGYMPTEHCVNGKQPPMNGHIHHANNDPLVKQNIQFLHFMINGKPNNGNMPDTTKHNELNKRIKLLYTSGDLASLINHVVQPKEDKGPFSQWNEVPADPALMIESLHAALDLLIDGVAGYWEIQSNGKLIADTRDSNNRAQHQKTVADSSEDILTIDTKKVKRACGDCGKCGQAHCNSHQAKNHTTIN